MTRVYADMVGDLFHHGHVELLRRARALGDELIVGVHSDETVMTYKRRPILTMDERISVVQACRYVDRVIPDAPICVDAVYIKRHGIDLVVHGDEIDQKSIDAWYSVPHQLGILKLVPYTASISTSELIDRIERQPEQKEARRSD